MTQKKLRVQQEQRLSMSYWYETTLHHLASILQNTSILRQLHMSHLQQLKPASWLHLDFF